MLYIHVRVYWYIFALHSVDSCYLVVVVVYVVVVVVDVVIVDLACKQVLSRLP